MTVQALLEYIKNDFNIAVYWKTLNDNGVTKERMRSYDRQICSEPNLRHDQKDGLIRDLSNYLRTLKVYINTFFVLSVNSISLSARDFHLGVQTLSIFWRSVCLTGA